MQGSYVTGRLLLNELTINDDKFIAVLLNTPGWLQFIGDRNVRTGEDAKAYIQKIIDNPRIHYWVATLKDHHIPIGIVTFIKRDYLEHSDIGFAFLPEYEKKGYAYEAASVVLNTEINDPAHTYILATTIRENTNSIKLLEKLGFRFDKEIKNETDLLLVYSVAVNKFVDARKNHDAKKMPAQPSIQTRLG